MVLDPVLHPEMISEHAGAKALKIFLSPTFAGCCLLRLSDIWAVKSLQIKIVDVTSLCSAQISLGEDTIQYLCLGDPSYVILF